MTAKLLLMCALGLASWPLSYSMQDDVAINEVSNEASLHQEEERIVGGHAAKQDQFPWAVALFHNGAFTCTATLISPKTVLTAAHCIIYQNQQLPVFGFSAIVDSVNRNAPETRATFSDAIIHPQYDPVTLVNDLAMLILSTPLPKYVRNICIANTSHGPNHYMGKTAAAMGWGSTTFNKGQVQNETLPDVLQYVELLIKFNSLCSIRYSGQVTDTNICGEGIIKGICQGDSGGPFVLNFNSPSPLLIGVASFIKESIGCGLYFLGPSVFTYVPHFVPWILRATNDTEICVM